jgi:predicted amidohydrolase YtcJ
MGARPFTNGYVFVAVEGFRAVDTTEVLGEASSRARSDRDPAVSLSSPVRRTHGSAGCVWLRLATRRFLEEKMKGPSASHLADSGPADLVLLNGLFTTLDDGMPEAEAVTVHGDRITAVGSTDAIKASVGPRTQVFDLAGRRVVPGFVEGHGHLLSLGYSLTTLELADARDWAEIVERVRRATAETAPGTWIEGHGWHQEKWRSRAAPSVEGYPVHDALSEAAPDHPVVLDHSSSHLLIANAAAMTCARITRETPDPPGGRIVRDAESGPTGVFLETARDLIERPLEAEKARRTSAQVEADARDAIRRGTAHCLARGITTFQDAGAMFEEVDRLRRLAEAGELGLRMWVMTWESNAALRERLPDYRDIRDPGGHLTFRAVKRLMDGALGARTAWLLDPYADAPSAHGLATTFFPYDDLPADDAEASVRYVADTAAIALEHGFQLCTHAIGDRAVREVLDICDRARREHPDAGDLRWRVEHASVIAETDIPRFGELGVIASMQGVSLPSDGLWMIDRLGEERARQRAFVFESLRRSGAIIANGSDTPVDDVDPLIGFHATATCRLADGTTLWPDERLSREASLRAYTLDGAYAGFEDDVKGSIAPGKLADMVVLTHDIMTVPDDEILEATVAHTILGGEIVYTA